MKIKRITPIQNSKIITFKDDTKKLRGVVLTYESIFGFEKNKRVYPSSGDLTYATTNFYDETGVKVDFTTEQQIKNYLNSQHF